MRILIPQGIGDSVWALTKVQDVAKKLGDGVVDVEINCGKLEDKMHTRALDFVGRFSFVNSVKMRLVGILKPPRFSTKEGYLNYIDQGVPQNNPDMEGIEYIMIPNHALERGQRLETWMPQFDINWNIMDDFRFDEKEVAWAKAVRKKYDPFAVFYMCSVINNTYRGHNRDAMWSPNDWVDLGNWIIERYGLNVVVVGAGYDKSYFQGFIDPQLIGPTKPKWFDTIGQTTIGQCYALMREASFFISYQSGIGIVSHYMGVPGAMWWRPRGNSLDPEQYISFEEDMAHCWTSPKYQDRYLPMVYGRHGLEEIKSEIEKRGWAG